MWIDILTLSGSGAFRFLVLIILWLVAVETLVLGLNPSPFLDWSVAALYFGFVTAVNVANGFLYWQDGFPGLIPF